MRLARIFVAALTLSLALSACGSDPTGPSAPRPDRPAMGQGAMGSGA